MALVKKKSISEKVSSAVKNVLSSTPLKIADLKAAKYNPRSISDEAGKGLLRSLLEFGDISGIVWNRKTGNLIAGHQRYAQLRKKFSGDLKVVGNILLAPTGDKFPIRVVEWDADKEMAANLAANAHSIMGQFTTGVKSVLDKVKNSNPDLFDSLQLGDLFMEVNKTPEFVGSGAKDEAVEGDDSDAEVGTSTTKMLQLFFNEKDYDIIINMLPSLQKKFKTENVSALIFEVLKKVYKDASAATKK